MLVRFSFTQSLCWSHALFAALGIGRYVSLSDVDLGTFPRLRLLPSTLPLPRPTGCCWVPAWFCGSGLSVGYQLSPLFLCRDGYGSGDRERWRVLLPKNCSLSRYSR